MIECEERSSATATFVSSGLASCPSHARLLFLVSCCIPVMELLGSSENSLSGRSRGRRFSYASTAGTVMGLGVKGIMNKEAALNMPRSKSLLFKVSEEQMEQESNLQPAAVEVAALRPVPSRTIPLC
jgi:hypothetical protein